MNRKQIKATAISTVGDLIVIVATLLAGFAIYGLLRSINDDLATVAGVLVGFVVLKNLGPIVTDGFRPAVDRLNEAAKEPESTDTKANA
ncbi:hypothetical protein P1P75_35785 [Streptomyces sp. ID05-39B]|uniref:hypothetical protein n=1 Tax=Streptomyces sp. ID05-39B TaxID=3028664 RepID=UPI0029B5DE75|nr:hypothetical protein [Streptomyces sp. ID05-39B]MDX3531615.1 hypothetical protein [Streptomyces sp. ID05-39B]